MKNKADILEEDADKEDLYTERGIDLNFEDDEITAAEEGFMRGYSEAYEES